MKDVVVPERVDGSETQGLSLMKRCWPRYTRVKAFQKAKMLRLLPTWQLALLSDRRPGPTGERLACWPGRIFIVFLVFTSSPEFSFSWRNKKKNGWSFKEFLEMLHVHVRVGTKNKSCQWEVCDEGWGERRGGFAQWVLGAEWIFYLVQHRTSAPLDSFTQRLLHLICLFG